MSNRTPATVGDRLVEHDEALRRLEKILRAVETGDYKRPQEEEILYLLQRAPSSKTKPRHTSSTYDQIIEQMHERKDLDY